MRLVAKVVSWTLLAVVIVAPAIVLGLSIISRTDRLTELSRPISPIVLAPTTTKSTDVTDGVLTIVESPASELVWSGTSGRITAVAVTVGVTLHNGDRVFDVDGVARIAAESSIPFFRDLQAGSVGPDVLALKAFIAQLGIASTTDPSNPKFDTPTGRAVQLLRQLLGEVHPPQVFDHSLVLWLPTKAFTVDEVLVSVGASVPATGSAVVRSAPAVAQATASGVGGVSLPSALVGGPIVDKSTGHQIATLGSVEGSATLDLPALDEAIALAKSQASSKGEPIVLNVTISRSTPIERELIAASAVMTDASGTETCLWTPATGGWEAVAIVPIPSSQAGTVALADLLPPKTQVLTNPIEVLTSATCPSK